ncbi:site-2 protease family protein [Ectothiorhodospiraceae bacterium 2226]|nr:site-2 protease family protein [Ectothiorhodospiraceae bacterium 2226]
MEDLDLMQRIAVWALPVLFAITVHEVAHGWMARRLGDPTALMMGRLTLNPIKHVDPVGTVLVPGILLVFTGFVFGWAKPVPVTWQNLRKPKRDMILVALAGPGANLLMAVAWALVARLGLMLMGEMPWLGLPLLYMGAAGILINIILMVLNLLPLPPLDGGRVVSGLLPGPLSWRFDRLEPFGLFILLGLLATGVLGMILWPPIEALQGLLHQIFVR